MRAKERQERELRQVQLLLPETQHRRLKAYAAMNGMTIGDVLMDRIHDIVKEPNEMAGSFESEKTPNTLFEMEKALKELLLDSRLPLDITDKRSGEVIVPANTTINDKKFRRILHAFEFIEIDPSPIQQKISSIIEPCIERYKKDKEKLASLAKNPTYLLELERRLSTRTKLTP